MPSRSGTYVAALAGFATVLALLGTSPPTSTGGTEPGERASAAAAGQVPPSAVRPAPPAAQEVGPVARSGPVLPGLLGVASAPRGGAGHAHPLDGRAGTEHTSVPARSAALARSASQRNEPTDGEAATRGEPPAAAAAPPEQLRLPTLDLTAELVEVGLDEQRRLEVPEAHLAGWYRHRAVPGQPGPAVIVGHLDGAQGPAVFFDLTHVAPGDPVAITLADGSEAVFVVDRVEVHPKDAFPTEEVYGHVDVPELRLITCGGPFDHAGGGYRDNIIVFASAV